MAKKKSKLGDPTGFRDRGRHTFHRHEAEVIRAWVLAKINQVQASIDKLNELDRKKPTPELKGQRDYWATVAAYLRGVYRGGTASIDEPVWDDAWIHVTVNERVNPPGAERPDQPRPPLM